MKISYFNIRNNRQYQEDFYFVKTLADGTVVAGVFDGHGGYKVAEYASKKAPYVFNAMKRIYSYDSDQDTLNKTIERLSYLTNKFYEGSCVGMLTFVPSTNIVTIAILGDCSVLVKTENGVEQTSDHNIRTNSQERQMAIGRGAVICQGYMYPDYNFFNEYGLQPTRTLGDKGLEKVLMRTPEITQYTVAKDGWILLATDGVLNSKYSKHTKIIEKRESMIAELNKGGAASIVIPHTFQDDNATAILIRNEVL